MDKALKVLGACCVVVGIILFVIQYIPDSENKLPIEKDENIDI